MKKKNKAKHKQQPVRGQTTVPDANEPSTGSFVFLLVIGLLTIAASTGNLNPGLEAWLWNLHEEPAPAWVWTCGGVGCVLIAIAELIPNASHKVQEAATMVGMIGVLHLAVFFLGAIFG